MLKKLSIAWIVIVLCFATMAYGADVTLTWDAPTTNADGTPLTDLAGYKIYTSKAPGVYTEPAIDVGNVTTKTLTNFCEGIYYFVATAYDVDGNESVYSNEVSKIIKIAPAPPSLLRWGIEYTNDQ